jgi:AAA domain
MNDNLGPMITAHDCGFGERQGEQSACLNAAAPPIKRAKIVCLADVERRPVKWLWEPYIPLGMVSMISGDPGAGKSFVALALCADVTRGRIGRTHFPKPADVLYMTFENPLSECLAPRFDSLTGDDTRFWTVTGTVYEDEKGIDERGIITFADLDLLDDVIGEKGVRLVVIDPLTSFFGEGKNTNHSADTRPVFDRLARLAERHGCAVLVIRHNNKQTGGKAIYRGGGSIDMTGAVRSEMLAAISPENPDQRALAHIKANVGPIGRTQGYLIESDGQGHVRFSWNGELALTAEELNASPDIPEAKSKEDEAREWLINLLRTGSREQKEIEATALAAGLKWPTVRRAKGNCPAIKSWKGPSMRAPWMWRLVEDAQPDADSKSLSTFGNLSTLQHAHTTKMLNLTPLNNEDDQRLNIRERDEQVLTTAKRGKLII